MAYTVKNLTNQVIPIVVGNTEIRIMPRQTVVLALDELTTQLKRLRDKKVIQVKG